MDEISGDILTCTRSVKFLLLLADILTDLKPWSLNNFDLIACDRLCRYINLHKARKDSVVHLRCDPVESGLET
jgi:hypothetical protein